MKVTYLFKVLVFFFLPIIIFSCNNSNPKVLIGLSHEEVYSLSKKYTSDNDNIVSLSNDSIEFIPLGRVCILSPQYVSKFKFHKGINDTLNILGGEDTVKLKFILHDNETYSYTINHTQSIFISALDKNINKDYFSVYNSFVDKSFEFTFEKETVLISFYENDSFIMNKRSIDQQVITKGRWAILQVEEYYFLILDDFDKIKKFQIAELANTETKLFSLNNTLREELLISKIKADSSLISGLSFFSKKNDSFLNSAEYINSPRFSAEYWLRNTNTLVAHDSATIHNIHETEYSTSVFFDWEAKVLMNKYNMMLSVEIDELNKKKLTLHPTNSKGIVNRSVSKTYYLN